MTRYTAFLRGINVGGITITMADLRRVFTDLGFGNVRTVLASGNVLFDTDRDDPDRMKIDIEAALTAAFDYEAWVVLLDLPAVQRVVDEYPFDAEPEGRQSYVMFTSDPSVLGRLLAAKDDLDSHVERIAGGDGVLYWEVERGMTVKSTFGKNTGKPTLKAVTTTRNLRTLHKLLS